MTDTDIYDEGSVYSARGAKGPRPGSCCASVGSAGSMLSHQCGNTTKVKRLVRKATFWKDDVPGSAVEREYCGIHDPKRVAEQRAKLKVIQDAKDAQRKAVRDYKEAKAAFECACVAAIEQIAAGHNDARGLAIEVMKGKPEHE